MRSRRLVSFLYGLPWLLTFVVFWAFPLVYSFVIGFTDYRLLQRGYEWVGWGNYVALFSDADFLLALKNTFIFVIGTIPATTIIALVLALMVNRQFRGRGLFRAGFFVPSITSMVVVALVFTHLYSRGGYIAMLASMVGLTPPANGFLYDSATALAAIMAMDVWMAVGYYMLIFLAGLKSIPDELYEAAEINGASPFRQFFSITLPLLRPVTLFIIVINSIKSFQVFTEIFVMTRGKFNTSSAVYFVYEKGLTTSYDFGYASAAAYLLFVIIGLLSLAQFALFKQRKELSW